MLQQIFEVAGHVFFAGVVLFIGAVLISAHVK